MSIPQINIHFTCDTSDNINFGAFQSIKAPHTLIDYML